MDAFMWFGILILCCFLFGFILAIVICCCKCRRARRRALLRNQNIRPNVRAVRFYRVNGHVPRG